jgi:hypothetical protein
MAASTASHAAAVCASVAESFLRAIYLRQNVGVNRITR